MSYLCGLISCTQEEKCRYYAIGCWNCKHAHYTPVTANNVVCCPDGTMDDAEDKPV